MPQLTSDECGTPTPSKEVIESSERAILQLKQAMTNSIPASVVNIPIKAHIIRQSNGTGGLDESTLNTAISAMNIKYQPVNLQFFLCNGVHYIDSDALYDCDVDTEDAQLVLNNVNDALNIYFANTLTAGSSGLNGIAAFPSGVASQNRIILYNAAVSNGSTLPHEVGHYFNLYHTHETAVGKELVTRGTGANCTTAGDLLCDTPADPCCYFYNASNCTYNGTAVDANGQTYSPLINNLMSYYTTCRTQFTSGQYNRMGDGYAYRLSLMQSSGAYVYNCSSIAIAAPTNVSVTPATSCGSNSLISWTDNSTNENGFIVERSTSPTTGFVAIAAVGANITSTTDPSPLAGIQAYYRVVAANSKATPSATVAVTSANLVCYCQPGTTNCSYGDQITNFTLKSSVSTLINKSSTCGSNGFSDFTATSATVTAGTSYTVIVTNPAQYPEGFTVWIDANQDKTFDASEIVFQSTTTTLQNVQQGTFVLPAGILAGQTRLRIRLRDDSSGGVPTSPCASYAYGETEDYTLVVPSSVFASAASGNWSSASTWASNQVPTSNDEVTINPPHTVTLPTDYIGKAKKLKLQGKITFQTNSKLQIGQ